jgi:signal transduction histidine kinase
MNIIRTFITWGISLIFPLLVCAEAQVKVPEMHLSQGDLDNNVISLDAHWAFYWQKFYPPDKFLDDDIPQPDDYPEVPCPWNMKTKTGKHFPRYGYGTYFLRLYVPVDTFEYSMKIRGLSSASVCYVNGNKLAQIGTPADNPSDAQPGYNLIVADLPSPEKTDSGEVYNIVFHVSNYDHNFGGFWDNIEVGKWTNVSNEYHKSIFWEMLVAGILLMLVVYHLIIFSLRPDGKPYLWFSLFVFFLLIRVLLTEEVFIKFAFPDIPYGFMFRLSYFATFSIVLCLLGFFNSILPEENNKYTLTLLFILMSGVLLTILFTPLHVYSSLNLLFLILTALVLLYVIFHVIGMAIMHRKRGVWILLISIIPGFVGFLNDAMYSLEIIHTTYLAHMGILTFVVLQSWYLAREFVLVYRDNHRLTRQLQDMNKNLETIVKDRTHDLASKQIELENEKHSLSVINKELKKTQAFQKKTTRMLVHDLKAPLGMLIQLSSEVENDNNQVMGHIRRSALQMQQLVHNLLDVHRLESDKFKAELKQRALEPIVKYAITLLQCLAESRGITIRYIKRTDLPACYDEQLLKRTISNLLNNAIKFSDEGGTVDVCIDNAELRNMPAIMISVTDHGPGVSAELRDVLFEAGTSNGEPWESHGLGLHFCKLAVEAMNGDIYLDTWYTDGARFNVVLPLTHEN